MADSDKETDPLNTKAPETKSKEPRELSTREAYFASLNEWVQHANISQNAMAMFPYFLVSSYPQMFQHQVGNGIPIVAATTAGPGEPTAAANEATPPNTQQILNQQMPAVIARNPNSPLALLRIMDDETQADFLNRVGGFDVNIAPFWKRAFAELIDVVILLVFKVMLAFVVMNLFDLDLGLELDQEEFRKAMDDDDYVSFLAMSIDFLAFSSDLLLLEILTKTIVCLYEAFWTTYYNGATPGKAVMKLRILYVEAVRPLAPVPVQLVGLDVQRLAIQALVFPGETPNLKRAFVRALAKNLIMTLFFPMCFIMVFFKNNRTAYDILTKTIVVEGNPGTQLLRERR